MKTKSKKLIKFFIITCAFSATLWGYSANAAGNQTWIHHCAICHGKNGKSDTPMGRRFHIKDLTKADVQKKLTDKEATKIIKNGVQKDGRREMPSFASKLSESQIKDLVKYIRQFKSK